MCFLAQPCLILCGPRDCSLPGSSVHRISQTRILEWVVCCPPGILLKPGIEPVSLVSPALACIFFSTSATYVDAIETQVQLQLGTQKSILERRGWWKEKFALFRRRADLGRRQTYALLSTPH